MPTRCHSEPVPRRVNHAMGWTRSVRDSAVAHIRRGVSSRLAAKLVAMEFGLKPGPSHRAVLRWARAAGVRGRPSKEEKREAVRRYANGEPSAKIAMDLRVTSKSVRKWVLDAGFKTLRGGGDTAQRRQRFVAANGELPG